MPQTLRLRCDDPSDVARCAEILQRGGLVAFPTETVYGLGANALSREAVRGIFAAKDRPSWDPLIVHLASACGVSGVAVVEGDAAGRVKTLAESFWPGPLTLLLPRRGNIPDEVTAARPLVGVRIPAHSAARALLRAAGLPIAAPSANRFGHISPTTAAHVLDDLNGRIDAVLDGGPCAVGVESTVLDPSLTPMRIYRAGAITAAMLSELLHIPAEIYEDSASITGQLPQSLPSPGVGIRHYAPRVALSLCEWDARKLAEITERMLRETKGKVGVMLPAGWERPMDNVHIVLRPWGEVRSEAALAADLFAALRELEQTVDAIICPLPNQGELRDALRDRLLKAARPR